MTIRRFPSPSAFLQDERRTRVVIVGAGGTGSMLADHVGRLDRALRERGLRGLDVTLFDDAVVRRANIGRQRFHPVDIGFSKAIRLVERINQFYDLDWTAVPRRCPVDGPPSCDLLIGCVDKGHFRHALGKAWRQRVSDTLYLDTGNGASTGQVLLGHLGHPTTGLRLPNVYDVYGDELLAADDDDLPSCSLEEALLRQHWCVNATIAGAVLPLLDGLFHRGGLDEHGYYVNTDPYSVTPIRIDPRAWTFMGIPKELLTAVTERPT